MLYYKHLAKCMLIAHILCVGGMFAFYYIVFGGNGEIHSVHRCILFVKTHRRKLGVSRKFIYFIFYDTNGVYNPLAGQSTILLHIRYQLPARTWQRKGVLSKRHSLTSGSSGLLWFIERDFWKFTARIVRKWREIFPPGVSRQTWS